VRSWKRWRNLTQQERTWLMRAVFWLVVVRIGLMVVPYRMLSHWAAAQRAGRPNAARPRVATLSWAVHAAGRRVPGATCLVRALTLSRLLGQIGMPCALQIGVTKLPTGRIMAHAWVEVDGVALTSGEALEQYAVLAPLQTGAA
jgi:hypothetical protein